MVDYVIELSDEFVPPPESGGVGLSDEYIAARVASINDKFATTDATGSFLAARGIIEADAVQTVDLAVVAAPEPPPDEPPTVTDPPPTKAPATDLGSGVAVDSVGELSAEDSPPLARGVVAIIVIGAILLVVLVLGAIARRRQDQGPPAAPTRRSFAAPGGEAHPAAGATDAATDATRAERRRAVERPPTTPPASNYLGPAAPPTARVARQPGARGEKVRVSTALPRTSRRRRPGPPSRRRRTSRPPATRDSRPVM